MEQRMTIRVNKIEGYNGGTPVIEGHTTTFNNVADMIAAPNLKVGDKCRTLGYYEPGDGGGNDYEIVAGATGTDDGGSFIDLSGSGLQAKGLFVSGIVHVTQFGAKVDGVITGNDDAVFVQNAVDYVGGIGGGEVVLGDGEHIFRQTLIISFPNITLRGSGKASVIRQRFNGDLISASDPAGPLKGLSLKNFKIKPSFSQITNASSLMLDGCRDFLIHDILINDGFVGLTFKGCSQGVISDVLCLYESNNGGLIAERKYIKIEETTNANIVSKHCGDLFFDNFNGRCGGFDACENGVEINSCDGIWFDNFHIGNCTTASFYVNANSSIKCTGILATNGWFDIGAAADIVIKGSTPSLNGNHYFRGNKLLGGTVGSIGIDVDGSAKRLRFSDNEVSNYANDGVLIRSGFTGSGTFVNNVVRDCSMSASGANNGISFNGSSRWKITDNEVTGSNHDRHIFLNSDSKEGSRIERNDLDPVNVAGETMNRTQGVNFTQKDNTGFNPAGSVSVPVGASPWIYTNPYGFPVQFIFHGGAITGIQRGSTNIGGDRTAGEFILGPQESVTLTYTSTPFVYIFGL